MKRSLYHLFYFGIILFILISGCLEINDEINEISSELSILQKNSENQYVEDISSEIEIEEIDSPVYNSKDWPMFGHDQSNSFSTSETVDFESSKMIWTYKFSSSQTSMPAIVNGSYFIGTNNSILSLNSRTGKLNWEYKISNQVASSPAVGYDTVYVGSHDHYFYALNAEDGSLKWKYKTGDYILSSPVIANGTVYFNSNDGYLYSLDAISGDFKWKYSNNDYSSSSPAVSDDLIFLSGKYLYALDRKTGEKVWKSKEKVHSSPSIANGIVYAADTDDFLYAYEALTGKLLWEYKVDGYIPSIGAPAISDGLVYFSTARFDSEAGTYIYALDAYNGDFKWKYKSNGWLVKDMPIIVGNGVYVELDNELHVFNAKTGELKHYCFSPLPIVADGLVYTNAFGEIMCFSN